MASFLYCAFLGLTNIKLQLGNLGNSWRDSTTYRCSSFKYTDSLNLHPHFLLLHVLNIVSAQRMMLNILL